MIAEKQAALMEAMAKGQGAERIHEYMSEYVSLECRKIEARVFAAIEADEALDPQVAVQAWIELHAITSLPKKLLKQVRDGLRASKKLAEAKVM